MAVHVTESKDKPGTFNATLRDEDAGESVQSRVGLKSMADAETGASDYIHTSRSKSPGSIPIARQYLMKSMISIRRSLRSSFDT
jgi:hypothetical protein